MKIIYCWIENFRNIEKKGFLFVDDKTVEYSNGKLILEQNKAKDQPIDLYGKKIHSINAIVGSNGTGKTSIMDFIGLKEFTSSGFIIYEKSQNEIIIEQIGLKNLIYKINGEQVPQKDSQFYRYLVKNRINYSIDNNRISYLEEDKTAIILVKNTDNRIGNSRSDFFIRKGYKLNEYSFLKIYNAILHLKKKGFRYENVAIQVIARSSSEIELRNFKKANNTTISSQKKEFILNLYIKYTDNILKNIIKNYFETISNISNVKDLQGIIKEFNFLELNPEFLSLLEKKIDIKNDKFNLKNDIEKEILKQIWGNLYESFKKENLEREVLVEKYLCKIIERILSKFKNNQYMEIFQLIKLIETKDEKYLRASSFNIDITEENSMKDFLKEYDLLTQNPIIKDLFLIKAINVSEGEVQLLNFFGILFEAIENFQIKGYKNFIFLLDEIESYLHPEWCRQLISELLNFFNQDIDFKISIVFATHSPFILSDLMKENIILLKYSGNELVIEKPENETLCSNINELLSSSFFLEYTVGEFIRKKLSYYYKKMKSEVELTQEEKKEIEFLIFKIKNIPINLTLEKTYEEYQKKHSVKEEILMEFEKLSDSEQADLIKKLENRRKK